MHAEDGVRHLIGVRGVTNAITVKHTMPTATEIVIHFRFQGRSFSLKKTNHMPPAYNIARKRIIGTTLTYTRDKSDPGHPTASIWRHPSNGDASRRRDATYLFSPKTFIFRPHAFF